MKAFANRWATILTIPLKFAYLLFCIPFLIALLELTAYMVF